MEFIKKCFSYLVENKALGIAACALAALILIAIIALIVKGIKNRKANKKAKAVKAVKTAKVTEKPATVVTQTAPAPVSQEEKERLRQETLARLAREEEEAEREEQALKKAQEQAEKKATAKKPVEKKQTAKKPAPKKEENLYETIAAAPIKPDLEDESEVEKASKYSGKWSIYRVITGQENEEETYFFELHASNGEKLLSSEEYTSYNGALRGIETHKTNIEKGNFKITVS